MSCQDERPIFFQRQPVLPLAVQRFLRTRIEAALAAPEDRALLVWPTVLGAPRLRQDHPEGLPEPVLFAHAVRMLHALGQGDPEAAWEEARKRLPDTAVRGETGWMPSPEWGGFGPLVSLRSGVALSALMELSGLQGGRYGLLAGVALFNSALFHEAHDALEGLWIASSGDLKRGLQGLILMAAGYHHLQLHNPDGMEAVWAEALPRLDSSGGILDTPWGPVDHRQAVGLTGARMAILEKGSEDLASLWALDAPRWEAP